MGNPSLYNSVASAVIGELDELIFHLKRVGEDKAARMLNDRASAIRAGVNVPTTHVEQFAQRAMTDSPADKG